MFRRLFVTLSRNWTAKIFPSCPLLPELLSSLSVSSKTSSLSVLDTVRMLTSHPNSGGQVQRPPDAQHGGCTWFLTLPGGSTWLPVAATCVSTATKDRLGAMTAPSQPASIFHIQPQNRTVMVVLLVRVIFPQMLNLHLILRFFRATPLLLSVANLISLLRVAPRLCIMMTCQELQWL